MYVKRTQERTLSEKKNTKNEGLHRFGESERSSRLKVSRSIDRLSEGVFRNQTARKRESSGTFEREKSRSIDPKPQKNRISRLPKASGSSRLEQSCSVDRFSKGGEGNKLSEDFSKKGLSERRSSSSSWSSSERRRGQNRSSSYNSHDSCRYKEHSRRHTTSSRKKRNSPHRHDHHGTKRKRFKCRPNTSVLAMLVRDQVRTNDRMDEQEVIRATKALQAFDPRTKQRARLMTEYLQSKDAF